MSSEFRQRASIAVNLVLAATVVLQVMRTADGAAGPAIAAAADSQTDAATAPAKVLPRGETHDSAPEQPPYLEMGSPSERRRLMIDRLRALGVPNEMLGRVARVDFEVEWDARFEACWGDPARSAAVQLAMNRNKDAEMRAALGEEDFHRWDQDYMLWEAMSTRVEVTGPEAEALYRSKKKLQARMLELDQARLDGTMDDAGINEAVDRAYAELNEQLRAVLGDERYKKSQQIDEAFIVDNFRHQLAGANPTDAQFQALFKVEKEWNRSRMEVEQQFQDNTFSPDYLAKLKALDAARDQDYAQVLGADVYGDLRKQQDPAYSQMKKYESRWGLNDDKIDYVYNTMRDYNESVSDYQVQVLVLQARGQSVDPDAINRNLRQFASEAQDTLRAYLGQDSFEKLQGNRVLRWATLATGPGPAGSP